MIRYLLLTEVAKDDIDGVNVMLLDKKRWYYVDKMSKALRHAKVVFKTHKLQKELVKDYRYHDPTKLQDKCIEVLLGNVGKGKWIPISTLRSLDKIGCLVRHKETYCKVPYSVYVKALKFIDDSVIDREMKEKILEKLKQMCAGGKHVKDSNEDKPIFVNSKKDLEKYFLKGKKKG